MICNKEYRLSFTEKAQEIVSQMTLEEKIKLMAGNCNIFDSFGMGTKYNIVPYSAGGCARLGVPEMLFCDGPRGVVSGSSTCFPVTMARGATFDTQLEERVGEVIGKEIRANGGNYFGGVCINIPYNPGNGRSQEVYGEDTIHMGKMAEAVIKGVQGENVIACIKHYAFNSMENSRFKVNVTANKRTEREIYLRQFKYCIDAGAASVMSAYNKYQGEHCGHNAYLLKDVLKTEWDFDGFVISDFFFGLRNTVGGLNGGLDVEMNIRRLYSKGKIKKALKSGKVKPEVIDEAALRIVRTLIAFDKANAGKNYDKSLIACKEHISLAREVAEKSITLMKNDNNILPLNKVSIKKLAVIGDLANIENIGDHGSSKVRPPYVKTLLQGLDDNYKNVQYKYIPTKAIRKESDYVKSADAIIIVAGYIHSDEGEFVFIKGGDRKNLGLKPRDIDMINYVSELNNKTIVALMGGNMIRLNEWKERVSAIIMAYYPGMEGGRALADIIFGEVNPSGKLPFVVAKSDKDLPEVDWDTKAIKYDYYHGYQKLDKEDKEIDYPYGYGLSYTTFELSQAKLIETDKERASFEITIKNSGQRKGAEVIQLYIGWGKSAVDRPIRALMDFKRIELKNGESKKINLSVLKSDLAYYNEKTNDWITEDIDYIAYIGNNERQCVENAIKFKFEK